ncbi:MAG: cold shock domain-containing protein [Alphaproteobacteria bacterium]|nr:cold shock domain-containing protein [Alphaproteobacteria bacterium]
MNNLHEPAGNAQTWSDEDPIELHLKWFNGTKGFGFVVPSDGSFDAFIHITTLQKAGLHAVGEGAVLLCTLFDGPKGKQVKDVVEVIAQGEVNLMPDTEGEDGTVTMGGLVKWYKPEKGFGFIIPDDGMKDVFIHKSLLDKLEIEELEAGQRVRVTLKIVDKGREAVDIKVVR